MSVHTKNFIIGIVVSVVIFACSYFIGGPDVVRLFITSGVGVLLVFSIFNIKETNIETFSLREKTSILTTSIFLFRKKSITAMLTGYILYKEY